jgi:hypothetical protein
MSAAIVRVMGFCWAVWVAADKADLLEGKGGLGFVNWRDYTTSKQKPPFSCSAGRNAQFADRCNGVTRLHMPSQPF